MKYDFLKLKDVFFKKIFKYLILEVLLIIVFISIRKNIVDPFDIYFGLYKFTFYDQIRDLMKVIDTVFIIYMTLNYYVYDLNKSPEFTVLRKTNREYIFSKMLIILSYITVIKLVPFLLFYFMFNNGIDLYLLISGIKNVIFIYMITISFVNIYSNKQYFILLIIILLFLYNLIFIINSLIIKLFIIIILFILNYFFYSTVKVYNEIIK